MSGTVIRWFAGLAAVIALVLAALGLAAPASFFVLVDPVLSFYSGNELLFLSGSSSPSRTARPRTDCPVERRAAAHVP